MRYEDLTTEQTKALLDAIRNLPDGWQELDDAELLALLPGRVTEADADPAPDPDPDPAPDPDPTPQGEFQFSVPVSGWGAESYLVHWGDESVEIAQSRGNRATLADIETALESMRGIRDVEVAAPGPDEIIEGTGGRPYRVEVLDADSGILRITKSNGKNASVRKVEAQPDPDSGTGSDTVLVNGQAAQSGESFDAGDPGLSIRPNNEQEYKSNYRLTWPENEGGTYRFDFAGDLTAPLPLSATESQLEAALLGLDGITSADVEGQLRAWEIEITATESETLELVDDGLVLGYVDLGLIA